MPNQSTIDQQKINRIYAWYANKYDWLFQREVLKRQSYAINALTINENANILDLGVGTGLSLPLYPKNCTIFGIDYSSDMLAQALIKVQKLKLSHVKLIEMDAGQLGFADNSFDIIFAASVITVIPDPSKAMKEIKRVAKPNCTIVFIGHFQNQNPILAKLGAWITPLTKLLGWYSDVSLHNLLAETNMRMKQNIKLTKFDMVNIVFVSTY